MQQILNLIRENKSLDYLFFDDDNSDIYYCSKNSSASRFTHLHKCVMITHRYPEINLYIDHYLQKNPDKINEINSKGWTALMLASRNSSSFSSLETVKILIKHGANLNQTNISHRNALFLASRYSATESSLETVDLLLKNKINVNHKDKNGFTALYYACHHANTTSNIETVKLLLENGSDSNQTIMDVPIIDDLHDFYDEGKINIHVLGLLIKHGAKSKKILENRTIKKLLKYFGYIQSKYEKILDNINQESVIIGSSNCFSCKKESVKTIINPDNKNLCLKCYYLNL